MFELLRVYVSALATVAPLVMCGGVGFIWGKKRLSFDAHFISNLVTLAGVPALIFHTLYSTEIENSALLEIGLVSTLALFLSLGLSALALKYLKFERRPNLQIVSFPNSGNLGLPLSALAFGEIGLSVAIVFFAICTFLHNTVGLRTISDSRDGSHGKILVMGSAIAAIAARLGGISLPNWLLDGLELIGSVTVPLMLLSLGVTLASISTKGLRAGSVIAGLRLSVGFISAVVICWLLGTPTALAPIIVLQMTMPCAVIGYVYVAKFAPENGQVAASAVLVSTLVFLATSPLLIAGLKYFYPH
ncbi:AEC family transporter [Paenalcaligenes niemegkensis]|uniref:AEC family transporter n=1 Tax=Paenalcaligenes niemegkensis TaxID=2895469 RepID=UPI001EE97B3D|nr:AEC family transporter [Paenalcaligenes niemegkensis]MCQ9618072.1 AEC family transporter [Paenalcaligenes niemegkensis]